MEIGKTAYGQLLQYWEQRARAGVDDCARVEWSRRTQLMRFEAFLAGNDLKGKSVLDVGCGVGHFAERLQARRLDCQYQGIDISPDMIARCRQRLPSVCFECVPDIDAWRPERRFDYSVAFGIHNVKVDGLREILERVTRRQFELSCIATHVSLLTDRFTGFAEHIKSWRAEEILEMALGITPYVVLRHDYLPNDFSITLYHEPLIDTRKDLILE